jgi:hypothetical protein
MGGATGVPVALSSFHNTAYKRCLPSYLFLEQSALETRKADLLVHRVIISLAFESSFASLLALPLDYVPVGSWPPIVQVTQPETAHMWH